MYSLNISTIRNAKSENLLLLFSLFLVSIPHLFRVPQSISLLCGCVLLWRLLYETGKVPLPGKILRFTLMLTGIITVLSNYQTIVGQYAGSALLVVMLYLKLTEFKTTRDAIVIVFLCYFVVITSFLFSQTIPVAIYMLITTVLLTTTLVAFQHPSTSQVNHFKIATQLLIYSIPLAIVLFVLFPRISGPLWGLPSDAFSAKTGMSDTMSPGSFNSLSDNNNVSFRVKFDSKIPLPAKRYWRGPVLWAFDGRSWSAPKSERVQSQFFPSQETHPSINYTITLEPHNQHWLFVLDMPSTLPKDARLTPEMQIISKTPVKQLMRYSMTSHTTYYLPYYDYLPPSRYLAVPDNLSPKAKILVDQWKQHKLSNVQIVSRALDYFVNNEFYYSRKPPLLFDDPVDEFLFETRKGYCEHYSSAFTVLMRIAGIPARVVTGYYGGEINPVGNYMIVRQSDAHAWSEVYLQDKGWVRVDPTSVIPPHRIEADEDIVRIKPQSNQAITILKENSWILRVFKGTRNTIDSINNSWNQWVIGYNSKKQASLFRAFGVPEITWKGLSTLMFSILSILLAIISYYIFRQRQQPDPVNKIYLRFCRKMEKAGFIKADNETASNFANRISHELPDKEVAVMKITTSYNNLHYGKYQTQNMLSAFSEQVSSFKL